MKEAEPVSVGVLRGKMAPLGHEVVWDKPGFPECRKCGCVFATHWDAEHLRYEVMMQHRPAYSHTWRKQAISCAEAQILEIIE